MLKRKNTMFILQSTVCFCFLSFISTNIAFAAPIINTSSFGNHGVESVISGSGFGSKAVPNPVLFDQFEDAVVAGQSLSSVGVWSTGGNTDVAYSNTQQRSVNSNFNVVDKMTYGGKNGPFFKNVYPNASSPRKLFISFWAYTDVRNVNASSYWQLKYWRLTAGPVHGDYPQISVSNWYYPDLSGYQSLISTDGTSSSTIWSPGYRLGQWAHTQLIIKESSGINVKDGSILIKVMNNDGSVTEKYKNNIATRTSSHPDFFQWMHLGYFETNNLKSGHEVHTYWDDIYIDDSWARVEIGNKPNYSDCTHLEVQNITSWNNDNVKFIMNNGSFQNGLTGYLFITDTNGNVSEGHPFIIGENSSQVSELSAPTDFRIVQ